MQETIRLLLGAVPTVLREAGVECKAKPKAPGSDARVYKKKERPDVRAGSTNHAFGERHPKTRLTFEQVEHLRDMKEQRPWMWSYRTLAEYAREAWDVRCGESTVRDFIQYKTRIRG